MNPTNHAAGLAASTLPEGLFRTLLRTWGLLRQLQDGYFAQFGISPSQWGILRVLERAEKSGQAALPLKLVSERLLVRPPSVTGVVNRLERQGLVQRVSSADDRRVRHLSLTPAGRELLVKVLEAHGSRIQALLAPLVPEEHRTMLEMLERLGEHFETLLQAPPPRRAAAAPTARRSSRPALPASPARQKKIRNR